ncbi:Ig-like domain-containing protein [Mycolicibacterium frederiksbergense]|uniref:Ig-like domain-containing protein n=1 Tax=Mycolicibacterium frederiksbergense TaxID=117567 RepID=UPI001F3D9CF2|nr:Ig-like domain-containing protein [Mycolicibacterium frederiksbergense]
MSLHHRRIAAPALAAARPSIGVLGGVVGGGRARCPDCAPTIDDEASAQKAPPWPAVVSISVPQSAEVNPWAPGTVSAALGELIDLEVRNEQGTRGLTTPDRSAWKPDVPLGYGRSYTPTATALGADGIVRRADSRLPTLIPGDQTEVTLTTITGTPVRDGGTYGVGTVAVVRFEEPIADRAAAARRMTLTTTPPVCGSWYWLDDRTAHWRPLQYFTSGTLVADIYGAPWQRTVRPGGRPGRLHRRRPARLDRRRSHRADPRVRHQGLGAHHARFDGQAWQRNAQRGQTISFWTQRGTYAVMDNANPVMVDSSTFGLPVNSPLGYKESINFATRISADGVYLQHLDSTVCAQGNTNVSHGCLNLNAENGQWFYDFSQPSDVVEVRNTGGAASGMAERRLDSALGLMGAGQCAGLTEPSPRRPLPDRLPTAGCHRRASPPTRR